MNDIPEYQSSKPLQEKFVRNVDRCGKHIFTQIKRQGNICLYQRTKLNGKLFGYELFKTELVKAGTMLFSGFIVGEDFERYPKAKDFGISAIFISGQKGKDKEVAEKYFEIWTHNSEMTVNDLLYNEKNRKQIKAILNK